jgi:hypothetical protein
MSLNPGTGDPIARLREADQEIARRRRTRSEFHLRWVLMDSDQVDSQHVPRKLGRKPR